jgi:hypothetical protein
MARAAARSLVDALESGQVPVDQCLMIAHRLARLMRDTDAQTWLQLEEQGYPKDITPSALGSCFKYAQRWHPDGTVYAPSLPHLEATAHGYEVVLGKLQAPTLTKPTAGFIESNSTLKVMETLTKQIMEARDLYATAKTSFVRARSVLHRYASDMAIALEFGDVAEGIFDAARAEVDTFVRSTWPQASEQLLGVAERMREQDAESLSNALTSCRRVLKTVADVVFPPRSAPYTDGAGKTRKVGEEEYVNRLLAFLETRARSKSSANIVDSNVTHLAARLVTVNDKASKGVHTDVSLSEARLCVIHTYLFLAEVARAHSTATTAKGGSDE